jgi:tetratricopeptide (TPR) repeat protein
MPPTSRLLPIRLIAVVLFGATWLSAQVSQESAGAGSTGNRAATQNPAPAAETVEVYKPSWLERGSLLLAAEDPVRAWQAFVAAEAIGPTAVDRAIGLGRSHLMLGHSQFATAYGEHSVAAAPRRQDAMALTIRALIRGREFDEAVRRSRAFTSRVAVLSPELLAARGSALFRVQRTSDSAKAYRQVVHLDQHHAEAHLRLGSGLLDPVKVVISSELRLAVGALATGERERAIELLERVLQKQPGHPIAHRLLGEALYAQRTAASMALQDEAFLALTKAMPKPQTRELPIAEFVAGYGSLAPSRRMVVDRTAALFRKQLSKLVTVGGRHDLLAELERTTDAKARANLRGRRTFDGRVWDDVRGVGGMQAATGIEALDEASTFGFDTFAHEVAHQVHFFTFSPLQRAKVRSLYRTAMKERRCLDYYAASNEAEYFGQGVEAFVSLAKRPGGETTHGHTRFELLRIDPKLHAFIATLVSFDPLADSSNRDKLLAASVAVAIRCGRCDDAVVAAEMMSPGARRFDLLMDAYEARRAQRSY